jgi:hypothetical protein
MLAFCSHIGAQNSQNPFDLKYNDSLQTNANVFPKPIKKPNPAQVLPDSIPPLSLEDELEGATMISPEELNPNTEVEATSSNPSPSDNEINEGSNPFDLEAENNSANEIDKGVSPPNPQPVDNEKSGGSNRWIFWVFLVTLFLLTVAVNFNRQIISKIYRSILNSNYSNLMFREQGKNPSPLFILLYILFFINAGLFLYLTIDRFITIKPKYFSLFTCIGLVSLAYILRHGILNLLGNVFPIKNATSQFGFNVMYFNIFLGLLLIPVNLFVAYGPEAIVYPSVLIGGSFIVILYLLRQIRGLFISRNALIFHKFHFFMYLCAVEIAPYFILVKLLFP